MVRNAVYCEAFSDCFRRRNLFSQYYNNWHFIALFTVVGNHYHTDIKMIACSCSLLICLWVIRVHSLSKLIQIHRVIVFVTDIFPECSSGGRCLSAEYTDQVGEVAKKHGLKLHIDGARIFNASVVRKYVFYL